jgi:RNA polymerase sigma factor (sigma-70 family)
MGINAEVQELTHTINLIFNKKKFDTFKKYCFKNNIYLIDELENDFVNNFNRIDGIGSKRVDNVKVKLAEAALLKNSIDLIFSSRKYKLFRDYCQKNNIKEIKDLNLVFIKNFKTKKGIGKGKIEDLYLKLFQIMLIKLKVNAADEFLKYLNVILEESDYEQFKKIYNNYNPRKARIITKTELDITQNKIEEIVDGYLTKFNSSDSNLFILKDNIKDIVKELKLSFLLDIYNIENNISEKIQLKEIMTGDIDEINKLEIELEKLILLFNKLNELENPIDLFKNLNLDSRSKEIFKLRYGEDKTLEEIAEVYNLTRERIRQILKFKIETHFSSADIQNKIIRYFQIISNNKNSINGETISQVLGENSSVYLSFFQDNISDFNYFEPFNIYYFAAENINDDINNIVAKLPEFFDIYDYLDNILGYMESIKADPNLDDVKIMLDYFGYNLDQSNEYAVKKK